MSEIMINYRNLLNPHLFELFFRTRALPSVDGRCVATEAMAIQMF
jgi:hypothetical protein